jgi:rubredoxin
MDLFKCTICGYVYDPVQGDYAEGIEPGTSFKDIPENWICPICGAGKSEFERIE